MYTVTIGPDLAGKTLLEIIRAMQQREGFNFMNTAYIVKLDEEIIIYPLLQDIVVQQGQTLLIFPLALGG